MLPAEADESSPPSICGTCGAEIPDYRREAVPAGTASGVGGTSTHAASTATAEEDEPVENRRYTRGSLFRALSDTVAEKGLAALAKRTPPGLGG